MMSLSVNNTQHYSNSVINVVCVIMACCIKGSSNLDISRHSFNCINKYYYTFRRKRQIFRYIEQKMASSKPTAPLDQSTVYILVLGSPNFNFDAIINQFPGSREYGHTARGKVRRFNKRNFEVNNKTLNLVIFNIKTDDLLWDALNYIDKMEIYDKANVVLFCYAVNSIGTLRELSERIIPTTMKKVHDIPFILAANNAQNRICVSSGEVTHSEVLELKNKYNICKFVEFSTDNALSISEMFETAVMCSMESKSSKAKST
ncbi:hypothetical protein NPIL_256071 [Nephila pilipes]|uniref:Uncharacterized protein n=1 Tax=Nephila pilipes TaxID=299642 RepID=A0A8X6MT22_NEPPI|nr:hypothetical protein NPIL_256071 [Nephila pilipes]